MGRMTRWAARLYPRWWRERYGEEFAALLEDSSPDAKGVFDVLKGALTMRMSTISAKGLVSLCSIAGLTISFASTFLLTPKYASSAILQVRGRRNSKDIVADIEQALSRPKLVEIISGLGLYSGESDAVERMQRDVRLSPVSKIAVGDSNLAFVLEFRHPDPGVAERTVAALSKEFKESQFRLLDPPSRSTSPVFPNRTGSAVTGLAVGSVAGGFWALARWALARRRLRAT